MRKWTARMLGFVVVMVFMTNSSVFAAANGQAPRVDVELLEQLTRCVDHNFIIVDRVCLKENFFPLLGLGAKDSVLQAEFGLNTDGRWFSMTIRKTSRSGGTVGLFKLTFYTERHRQTKDGNLIFFEAKSGDTYGKVPNDYIGVMSIYDLAKGDYLVNDKNGKVVGSLTLPDSQHWSVDHTLANLINAGKTVGYILEEHLGTMERLGQGCK